MSLVWRFFLIAFGRFLLVLVAFFSLATLSLATDDENLSDSAPLFSFKIFADTSLEAVVLEIARC